METVQLEIQSDQLTSLGCEFHPSKDVMNNLGVTSQGLQLFQSFWNNLPTDQHMADGGVYRQRRFGVYHYIPGKGLAFKGNEHFFQSKNVNKLNGGVARSFETVEHGFAHDPVLISLLYWDLYQLPEFVRSKKLKVYIHQIRILANPLMTGNPTPEGIHQDGHLYVAQHLVKRNNVSGGTSQIYNLDKFPVFTTTLKNPLDTLIVNDPYVFHSVTPITSLSDNGTRDMLLVDFNFLEEV
ncbi:MAG: 2OG-Fe dioxygenase family protein [Bdellovibrionota bacterium]